MSQQQDRQTILAVDDTPENLDVVKGILSSEYIVKAAINGTTALKIVEKQPPDLILLDINMPGMDGYEVCRQLKANRATKKIPIIFLTANDQVTDEARGLELGGADYILKPVCAPILKERVKTQLALYNQNFLLECKVKERTKELEMAREEADDTCREIIKRLARAAEYKDSDTGDHVLRMSHYARLIAKAYGINDKEADLILNAAPMHDVGKIGIPDHVLLKPGKLDKDEWEIMQQHTTIGVEIIGDHPSELITLAQSIAHCHHEKWDGSGYPRGLTGEHIPLSSRIIALADVFDALTSVRPYKEAWPIEKTIKVMTEDSGTHFDPKVFEAFIRVLPEMLEIKSSVEKGNS